ATKGTGTTEQRVNEQSPFNGDLRPFPLRQLKLHALVVQTNERVRWQHGMRRFSYPLIDSELPQNRPALRIQTIAAHFLPRKSFAFHQNRPQSRCSAKCCANRPCGSAADDRDIKMIHRLKERLSLDCRLSNIG